LILVQYTDSVVATPMSPRGLGRCMVRPTERGCQPGQRPGVHEFRGPTSQTRKKTSMYLYLYYTGS